MIARVVTIALGTVMVAVVLDAAIRTLMLPRATRVRFSNWVARGVGKAFSMIATPDRSYHFRDRLLAFRPPAFLLGLHAVWLFTVFWGFVFILWGSHEELSWANAMRESGSALFTLGFATPDGAPLFLIYGEALIGLTLMALLISYLPTIYDAFRRRELLVTKLSVRAGSPPQPWRMLVIAHTTGSLAYLDERFWSEWEDWFVDIAESHTSLTVLNYYRSPEPDNHWMAAAAAVLDMAALRISVVAVPLPTVGPHIVIRTGTISLRALARHLGFDHDPDPAPHDPIHLGREMFDAAWEEMDAAGVPLVDDREAAWRAFAGWRVNYDSIVTQAARALDTPPSPWDALVARRRASAGADPA